MYGLEEHNDFHYATDAEWDRAEAAELGAADPDVAWVLTDRDVWHANPSYVGPPVPHPEEDYYTDESDWESYCNSILIGE